MPPKERSGGVAGLGERLEGAGSCHNLPQREAGGRHAPSRNPASLAVTLNWGIGSNSLKAVVKALERLQSVRGEKSSYCGLKYCAWTTRSRWRGASRPPSINAR